MVICSAQNPGHQSVAPTLLILPRDAMLARYMLSSCVCLSVRPSVTSRYCIQTTRQIKLVLARELRFIYPNLRYEEIWVSQKSVLPSTTFARNCGLRKFRHGKSVVGYIGVENETRRRSNLWISRSTRLLHVSRL